MLGSLGIELLFGPENEERDVKVGLGAGAAAPFVGMVNFDGSVAFSLAFSFSDGCISTSSTSSIVMSAVG